LPGQPVPDYDRTSRQQAFAGSHKGQTVSAKVDTSISTDNNDYTSIGTNNTGNFFTVDHDSFC
jgi:hypothetical protein